MSGTKKVWCTVSPNDTRYGVGGIFITGAVRKGSPFLIPIGKIRELKYNVLMDNIIGAIRESRERR